jgi:hypothetical protein
LYYTYSDLYTAAKTYVANYINTNGVVPPINDYTTWASNFLTNFTQRSAVKGTSETVTETVNNSIGGVKVINQNSGVCSFIFPSNYAGKMVQFKVYSITGQVAFIQKVDKTQLDIKLYPGVYLYELMVNGERKTMKFIAK